MNLGINETGKQAIIIFGILLIAALYFDFIIGLAIFAGILLWVCIDPRYREDNLE